MSDPASRLNAALEGRYHVERELGAGGMATVYLADDLKHERKVALKVLKPELAAVVGAERFLSEIKTTANLQHPHILPLYDSGEADGFLFYVMPYVAGESLRDLLEREQQLPVEDAVRIGCAVADALDYAHRHDVIHRDVKPENILLHDGNPLVADFGIALAVSEAGAGRLTETGLSLGTPYYMSPEQATAERTLGPRADVYSLGCVVYEMLTGAPPHVGPTAQSVLARILTEEPRPVRDARSATPANVAAAVTRAIQKLPADRFGSAAEFRRALLDASFGSEAAGAGQGAAVVTPRPRHTWLDLRFVTGIMIGLGGILYGLSARLGAPGEGTEPLRLSLDVDVRGTSELEELAWVVVSPDGLRFAYGTAGEEGVGIYMRGAEAEDFRLVEGTEGGVLPAFSPDGRLIAFAHPASGLRVVPVEGGIARPMFPGPVGTGLTATWWDDESILVSDVRTGLYLVSATGGAVDTLFHENGTPLLFPARIPGTDRILATEPGQNRIVVFEPGEDSLRTVVSDAAGARYVAQTGHLVFGNRRGQLFAASFDARRGRMTGDPVPLLDGLTVAGGQFPKFSLSETGMLVYNVGGSNDAEGVMERLVEHGFDGSERRLPLSGRMYTHVRWAPDGRTLAFAALEPGDLIGLTSIYTYDVELRTATQRLTHEGAQGWPVWSGDGRYIAFAGNMNDQAADAGGVGATNEVDVWVMAATPDSLPRLLVDDPQGQFPYSWTPDGQVLYTSGDPNSSDLFTVTATGEPVVTRYLDIDRDLRETVVSPDGSLAAMASNELGGSSIIVRAFPTPGEPVRVSSGDGDRPRWGADGRTLFYWADGGAEPDTLKRVRLTSPPRIEVLEDEAVYIGRLRGGAWDVHPDGDRIITADRGAAAGEEEETPAEIRDLVILNFFELLRERVPR